MSEGPVRAAIRRMITVRWRLRIWAGIAIVFAVVVGFLPLMGVLGYPLALAAALLGSIAGLDIGCAFAKELQRASGGAVSAIARATWPGRMLARSTLAAAGLAVGVVLVPVPICVVRGFWVPTCDWWFGIVSYVALALVTTALAAAVGHLVGVVVGPRRVVGGALCALVWIAVALAAFWRFYSEPPVFTYNAILGYFPGNLYDENVQLKAALWWSRLEQAAWVVAVGALVATRFDVPTHRLRWQAPRPDGGRKRALAVAAGAAAVGIGLWVASGWLGYAIDDVDLQEALGGRIETEHFVIYHSTHPDVVEDMELVARDHEFRYAQLVAQTGVAPARKIRSYVFADPEEKARLFGPRNVQMAKPWLGDIYVEHTGWPIGPLRHEIAHAVAAEFGDPIFGVAARRVLGVPALFSPGLIEGLAVALDWPGGYDRPTPHESVRAMQAKGDAPSVDQLFGLGFLTFSSQRAYTTAGSFLRFLLDRYGAAKVRAVYFNGGDFEAAYGMSRGELARAWQAHLSTIQIPPQLGDALAERFRVGSVFARPCPLAIAKRRSKAARAEREGDRAEAVELMRRVCDDAPDEPRYRLELASYLWDGSDAQLAEAEAIWRELSTAKKLTSTLRATALEGLSRVAVQRGELARAKQLVAEALALPLEVNEKRQLANKALALAHQGPAAQALVAYAYPPRDGSEPLELAESIVALEPQLAHGHYLLGLQYAIRSRWPESATALARALELGITGAGFEKNAARRLAVSAYRAGDRKRVEQAIAVLGAPHMSTGDQLLAKDWAERLAFDARHGR